MFDVAIIGGGHAGLEAAWAAAQFDLKVAIVTMPGVSIASAPCNPAVGGVGKGQVVREIDALGGIMGKLADRSAIQYRTLNESKGYAVQSTRVQIDKEVYARNAEAEVAANDNITVIREMVERVSKDQDSFLIKTAEGEYLSKKIVVTTGTFLAGKMHTGEEQSDGGRVDCLKADSLENIFVGVSALKTRFKTGTPARLKRDSIDFSKMVEQESDPTAVNFHFGHDLNERFVEQVSCHLTKTNEKTLGIIRDNKERSPIFNGQIKGVGPRYCPSIEDKAYRYEDKDVHHVFVEPESLELDTFYPNGISTSLPREIQLDFIRTIEGLEKAEIAIYGYAVEYDVVDTTCLDRTLQSKEIPGLYFAGQVNGTSGYEEAAGQGLIAGVNAARSAIGAEKFILDREDSYIGVMVEDLVSNKRDEPYRLFTARNENRLYVREDNTILRMKKYRQQLGLYADVDQYQESFERSFNIIWNVAKNYTYKANPNNKDYFTEKGYGPLNSNITLAELSKRAHLNPVDVLAAELNENNMAFDPNVIRTVAISLKYEGYIDRALVENAKINRLSKKPVDWKVLVASENISFECRQRITEIKPESFGQLQRIVGIRPATLAYVAGNIL
ncbi:tRNA uridine-5-carboxymethylaminomethyl(34) synthesis enzyme MnmG [Halobacteriovorax sp. CON-3]|uniref:tRNA uridine-5-carboxymethylaminomethyl(34) synthesis enzyme MnmG n=1 Tax=Halobacteriovorax sp. CON-3 TaxID=3157710 RepID=UPI003712237A